MWFLLINQTSEENRAVESFLDKKGIILGIANNRSIASAIAKHLTEEGARIGYSFLPDESGKMEQRVKQVTDPLDPCFLAPCDVTSDESIALFFKEVEAKLGKIDFIVHSIAFAPIEDLRGDTIETSRSGFKAAMDISVYSLLSILNASQPLLNEGGSVCAMTYFGGEKVIPGYNIMGVCKAALDHAIKYAAFDLGKRGVRVNGISAGPIRTLASSAVGDFKEMLKINAAQAPLQRNVTQEDVAKTTAFLLSPQSSSITGEILHVDNGYSIMGGLTPNLKETMKA